VTGRVETAYNLVRGHRRIVALLIYIAITAVAYAGAFMLRFEFTVPPEYARVFGWTVGPLLIIRIATLRLFRLTRERWRYASTPDAVRLAAACATGSAVLFFAFKALPIGMHVPKSVLGIEFILTCGMTAGVWMAYRLSVEHLRRNGNGHRAKRVLIVGAGDAGNMLAREMLHGRNGYLPIGFVDDDPRMRGATILGLEVLGGTAELTRIAERAQPDLIVIAVPSATPADLRRVVEHCEGAQLPFKVLPGIASVIAGNVALNQLRDLRIEDLLGREPIKLEVPALYEDLRGRSVLITGAAGSIGSELARQVALHDPALLVLLDQAETPLFYLERELRERHPDQQMVFMIADVVDPVAVNRAFRDYAPSRVYHAAAYKHVPMMQTNAREAVRNNVLGTYLVAAAAGASDTEKFVLVSTDKAVNPTSVMGATKRLAELAMLELQKEHPATTFAAVRFGNVLGSSGSVIPIFKEQIESGRPLTVTHPEATRYFMTIPEAVHLILQASLLPQMHGRIAMLEMGEPVRILDLAKNLLRLSGLPHDHRSAIVFTGLRSGEKLHEELIASDEITTPTSIMKIRMVQPSNVTVTNIADLLAEWDAAFHEGRDNAVVASMMSLFVNLDHRLDHRLDLRAIHKESVKRQLSAH
jgi:FlaA1/EpsC-like NDP-sugar epimerase